MTKPSIELRPELRLSRLENVDRSPGIVLVIFGYFVASCVSIFLFPALLGNWDGSSFRFWTFSPIGYLCLMFIYAAMTGADHRRIYSAQLFLFVEAFYFGIRYVYVGVEHPQSGVLEYPRASFSLYAGELVSGTGRFLIVIAFLFLLFLPSVRRWAKSGVRSFEEAVLVQTRRFQQSFGVSETMSETQAVQNGDRSRTRWLRIGSCVLVGAGLYLSVSFLASIVGQTVTKPEELSYESLIEQLETEDHWQLRWRQSASDFIGLHVLKYSAGKSAQMPPNTVKELRLEAIDGLARYGKDSVEILESLLADPDRVVRHAAVQAIGGVGESAAEAAPAVRALISEDVEQDAFRRGRLHRDVAMTLISISPEAPETLDAIQKIFEMSKGPGLVGLVVDLANNRETIQGRSYLTDLLSRESEPLVFFIMRALRSRDTEIDLFLPGSLIEVVAKYLNHSEASLRREAALLLARLSPPSNHTYQAMVERVADEHPAVCRAAADALAVWYPQRASGCAAMLLNELRGWNENRGDLSIASYWSDDTSMVRPGKVWGKGTPVSYSSHDSLSEFGMVFGMSGPSACYRQVREKLETLREPNEFERVTTRRFLVRALGRQGRWASEAAPLLREIAADENAPERWEASIALWRISKQADEVLEVLNRLIDEGGVQSVDPRYEILVEAIDVFPEMGGLALPALARMAAFEDYGLKLKVMTVLEPLLKSEPQARAIVESMQEDKDSAIRTRARKVMRTFAKTIETDEA